MYKPKPKTGLKIEAGMRGYLLTHNACKTECVRDAYHLLNYHANIKYGAEEMGDIQETVADDVDVEKKLLEEIEAMKNVKNRERRFQNVKTKCKNCVFISTKVEDPVCLVDSIFETIKAEKSVNSRYIYRIIPIQYTCKANINDITKTIKNHVASHFPSTFVPDKSYLVVVKIRNNNTITRDEILDVVTKSIKEQNEFYCANLKHPNITILFEVLCTICCISYVNNYFAYNKFNMVEYLNSIKSQDIVENKDD